MPYSSISQLPPNVKNVLPTHAQRIYLRAFNSAMKQHDDEDKARKIAWAAVKRDYKRGVKGKMWTKMNEYFIPFADRGDGWYLYFPVGTVYHHRRKIDFTAEDAKEMCSQFGSVPDYQLPVNILHDDSHGVYGYIEDLRFAGDEVQWKPAFRPEKIKEIQDKGYKYASPEVWFKDYQAPDGKEHNNVALGIALTPRPRLGRATALFSDGEWVSVEDDEFETAIETLTEELAGLKEKFGEIPISDGTWRLRSVNDAMDLLKSLENYDGLEIDARNALEALKKIAHKIVDEFEDADADEFGDREKEKKAQKARSRKYGIAIHKSTHLTKPREWANVPESQYGDPVNWKYPCPDKKQTQAAVRYFGAHKGEYNTKSRAVVQRRLNTFAKKFKIGTKEDKMSEFNEEAVQSLGERLLEFFGKNKPEPEPVKPDKSSEQLSELEAKMSEFETKLAEKETELLAEKEAKEAAEKEAKEFSDKLAEEEHKRKLAEFTEVAKKLNAPIKPEEFGSVLMAFHDSDPSEDKVQYKLLISALEAMGNQEKMAALFSETGTDAVGADPMSRFDRAVENRMKEAKASLSEATEWVAEHEPGLYNDYNKATLKSGVGSPEAAPGVEEV